MTAERRIGPLGTVRLAVSWLTVAPVGTPRATIDRRAGAAVIAVTPLVGALLGGVVAGVAWGLSHTRAPELLIGILLVAVIALATRGMHLDGLADTADGLGSYGDPQRTRDVMHDGPTGPFGAATLVLVLMITAVCFTALVSDGDWYALGFAVAVGRLGAVIGCRRRLGPADSTGFGALVAGTQRWAIPVWAGIAVAAAYPLGPAGFAAVAVVALGSWVFTAHCARRVGGINGDVLGATIELSVAAALLALVF
ncbi:adenosylcobinamide-GDP ribazoletransferase [Gordonia crocea]|uniref:Adenosylcobinamide-GDP ribazoletransferase n=1 Tax=Gordonia crocea TaxID=589162 RepID=A0A7I9V0C7_9ACTN|nr:adenosylcobinamide-GDP ribazoletransferase [Gordonia crocea]GED98593.1 adenosylcobinamide-GDP ribazoletransferase [Gordonia crocea]